MIIWGMAVWWYTDGWRQCLQRCIARFESTVDFFSFTLLLKTLFAPFRQISAGRVGGSFEVQMQAFFDRTVSRCIGAVVRLFMLAFGSVVIIFQLLFGGILLIGWACVPFLPIVGAVLYVAGWLPWIN